MSTNNQAVDSTVSALNLLLIDSAETNEAAQCIAILSETDLVIHHDTVTTQTTLTSALNDKSWDFILICSPLETLNLQKISTLKNEHDIDAPLLMLANELADEHALNGLSIGIRNILSLQYPQHFQLTFLREVEDLKNHRLLTKFQKMEDQPEKQNSSPITQKKDLLTGLYTKHFFNSGIEQLFKKTPPAINTQHGILFISLDKIDAIREQSGIATADIIIAEIANCIRRYIPASYPIARTDDHSFSILIPKTSRTKIEPAATALCKMIAGYTVEVAGSEISSITCSIGIAITNDTINTAQQLISKAKMASQAASAAGGNQSHLFDPENDEQYGLKSEQQIEMQWEKRIQIALKENRFKLLYQPIVSLKSNTAEHYELLLRMLNENNEEILPGEFMPSAAKTGLMPAIDRWVTHNALVELSERRRDGKDTSFFIKIDHTTLGDSEFHAWLSEELRSNKMPGDALIFEVSERSDLKAPEEVAQFIKQLKVLHCRCGLDHFGDNESSLERLQRLPVDFIKIDRSLIQRLNTEPDVQAKVKLLVGSAHEKEQKAIAEFVQDASTLSALWTCGMDYIQGYFLQRPDGTMDYDFTEEN